MYTDFRKVVEQIIERYSNEKAKEFLEKDIGLKIKRPSFDDLSIEKCGDILFVGYYYKQNGDLLSDPIFVFRIKNDIWYPIRIEQVIMDTEIGKFEVVNGEEKYLYRKKANSDVKEFSIDCSKEWIGYYLNQEKCESVVLEN